MKKRTARGQHTHIDLTFNFLSFSLVLTVFYIFYSEGFSRCITFDPNRVLKFEVTKKQICEIMGFSTIFKSSLNQSGYEPLNLENGSFVNSDVLMPPT